MAKPVKGIESKAEALDRLVAELDPQLLLAGALGAVAVKGGLIPPFTRMLMAISNLGGSVDVALAAIDKDYQDNKTKYMDAFSALSFTGGLIPGIFGTIFFQSEKGNPSWENPTPVPVNIAQVSAAEAMRGMMAAGALEAMMMMAFMQNPKAIETVTSLVKEAAGGAKLLAALA